MTLYLDTSALVKLYADEEGAGLVRDAVSRATIVSTSVLAFVEARAAFARRSREGFLSSEDNARVRRDLDADWPRFFTMQASEKLVRQAAALAETHKLRAYDAVHLASAITLRDKLHEPVIFAAWDTVLENAAKKEGLTLLEK